MKRDTQNRIKIYQERIPYIKEKLSAAGMGLLVAFIVAASATFAWITLSRAPEVSEITTNLSANGSLEIALSKEDGSAPDEFDIDESAPRSNDVTVSNLQWGNLINLSDKAYGIDNLALRPAQLNTVSLLTQPLKGAVYSGDGRITMLDTNYAYAKYFPDKEQFLTSSNTYGVRAIASYTQSISDGTTAAFKRWKQAVTDAETKVQTIYSDSNNGVAKTFSALGTMISKFAQDKVDKTSDDATKSANLAPYLGDVLACFRAVQRAMEAQKESYVALANFQQFVYAQNTGKPFTEVTWEQLVWDPAQYNITSPTATSKNGIISLMGLTQFINDLNLINEDVEYLDEYFQDFQKNGTKYSWKFGAPDGKPQIYRFISDLISYDTMTIDIPEGSETKVVKLQDVGASIVTDGYNNTDRKVFIYNGILIRFEQLAVEESYRLNGNANCTVSISYFAKITLRGKAYTKADGAPTFEVNVANVTGGASLAANESIAEDTYGMVVDFWLRTNAERTCLTLEGAAVKNEQGVIERYDGVNRIWGASEMSSVLTTDSTTQGGGSCYIYYADSPEDMSRSLNLLEAMRVAFVDQAGNLLAEAEMDTVNYYAVNGRITVPLVLDTNTKTTYTYTDEMNVERTGRAITTLYTDRPQRISAIIYLDGTKLTNDDVLAAAQIQGQLNLQFGSSTKLKTIGDTDLMGDVRAVEARVSKTQMDYDTAVTEDDLTTEVFVDVKGTEPTHMTAFFVRAINTTQGSREETMVFTRQENGTWHSSYKFSAPGTYHLRHIRMDGVDYALATVPKVEINGFTVESVLWGESGDSATVYTSDAGYSENVAVKFATNDQTKMPKRVQARFERQDGNQVDVEMKFSSSTGMWSGKGNFSVSGVYSLKYLIFDGKYMDLTDINMVKTLDLKLGLYVVVKNGEGATEEKYTDGASFSKDLRVYIYDNSGTELKGLEGAWLYYSNGGSASSAVSTDLIWNEQDARYDGVLPITRAGRYSFLAVELMGSQLTKCLESPVYAIISPDPPTFDPESSEATYYSETQFAPLTNDAVIDHLVIKNSSSATIKAVVYSEKADAYMTVSNELGTMVYSDDGWIIKLPTYMPSDSKVETQEGKWRLIALSLSECYDKNGNFRSADRNPIIWADTSEAATTYLRNSGMTAEAKFDFSKLSTNVSCTFNASMEPGKTALGKKSADFMSRFAVSEIGMYVHLTDDAGNTIPASKIYDVTLNVQYVPNTTENTYGYKVQQAAGFGYAIKLNQQDDDTGHRTVNEVNGAKDLDWQYVGEYKVSSLQITLGSKTVTYTVKDNIGLAEKYTITTAGPSAENLSLSDENIKQRYTTFGMTGDNVTGTFLQSYDPGITAKISLTTPDNSNTEYVILDDVNMQLQMTYKGGSQQYGGYTYSGVSEYESISKTLENNGGTYSSASTTMLAGQYGVKLQVSMGSAKTEKQLADVAVYSKCPTLKVKNVNPNSGRSFTMNPVTDKFKWEEVKNDQITVQNYYSDFVASVYIESSSTVTSEGDVLIAKYTLPKVTFELSNVEKADYDAAVITVPNENKDAKANVIEFGAKATEKTGEIGYILTEKLTVSDGGEGCSSENVEVDYYIQKPVGEQTISTVQFKKGDTTYTAQISDNVTIREKSVAPPSIQFTTADGFDSVEAKQAQDGAAFEYKLPTSLGQKDGKKTVITGNENSWKVEGSPVSAKLCYYYYDNENSRSVGGCLSSDTKYTARYTYYLFTKTTTHYVSDPVVTTDYKVKLGLTGWKIGDKVYQPGETILVSSPLTAEPIIDELDGTRIAQKTLTRIGRYDHIVVAANSPATSVVNVSCMKSEQPTGFTYLRGLYAEKKPAGYEWADATNPKAKINPSTTDTSVVWEETETK